MKESNGSQMVLEGGFWKSVIDTISSNVAVLDANGLIVWVNHSWRAFALANGVSPDEVSEGINYLDICERSTGAESEGALEFIQGIRSVQNGSLPSFSMEYPCHSPSEKRWFLGRVTRFENADGVYLVIQHENITDRKNTEDEFRLHNAALEAAANAIIITDINGRIIWVNPAFERLTGYPKREILGKNPKEVVRSGKHTLQFYKNLWDTILDGRVWHNEIINRRKDGTLYTEEMTITPVRSANRQVSHFIAVKKDVTETSIQKQELEAIAAMSSALRASTRVPSVYRIIFDQLEKLIGLDACAISIFEDGQKQSSVCQGFGEWETWTGKPVRHSMGLLQSIRETNRAALIAQAPLHFDTVWPGPLGSIQSVVCLPLVANNTLIGAMWLGKAAPFNTQRIGFLENLGDISASAIQNAVLYKQVEDQVTTLTALYEAGLALNSVLEPHAQLGVLAKTAMRDLQAERMVFVQYIPEDDCFRTELCLGFSPDLENAIYRACYPSDASASPMHLVFNRQTPLYITTADPDPDNALGDTEVRSILWVPVKFRKKTQGVLGVMSSQTAAFNEDHQRLLVLYANQAAVSLENARLLTDSIKQNQRLRSLRKIDEAINASLDITVTTNILLEQVLLQLKVDAAAILLYNSVTKSLRFVTGRGFTTNVLQHTDLRLGQGLAGRAANERQIIHVPDLGAQADVFSQAALFKEEHFKVYYGIPLISKGAIKGVLEIFHRQPMTPDENWHDFMEMLAGQAAIAIDNIEMFESLQTSNNELTLAYDATIEGWSRTLDLRDQETEGHTKRVANITLRLARAVGVKGDDLLQIYRGGLLHDIGKMGIPDNILLKPGPLTDDEWLIMRKHPDIAYDLLSPITFLKPALDIPYCHHEKWDGSGYPRGLSGEHIPLSARLFAVADVWDALTFDRPYRAGWTEDRAADYIREQAGKHFDPKAVEVFFNSYLAVENSLVKPTILIVDDEESVTRLLARSLNDQFTVLTAASGLDALAIVERAHPAVILTDQNMPGMSGLELLDRIGSIYPKAIGILISGHSDVVTLTAAINLANVRGFIPKSWDIDTLRKKLDEAVSQYREMVRR